MEKHIIKILKDKNCNINVLAIADLINTNSQRLEIEVINTDFDFPERLIIVPTTQKKYYKSLKKIANGSDLLILTDVPYDNNYFFESHEELIILSFYNWKYLTSLPKENGLLYWLCDIALATLQEDIVHEETTGCINDFLNDKSGIDLGMRHASLCSGCLKAINKRQLTLGDKELLEDVKFNLDILSKNSRWNKSVLDEVEKRITKKIGIRQSLKKGIINVLIASPSDTAKEREILLEKLEREFRINRYEESTGFRVIPIGWEELASQSGYPQDIINQLILPNVDIVIGVLKHKLGTPTKDNKGAVRADSGTAEELYYALEKNPSTVLCMLYVYPIPPAPSLEDPNRSIIEQNWMELKRFKDKIKDNVLYKPYNSEDELLNMVIQDLVSNIKNYFNS